MARCPTYKTNTKRRAWPKNAGNQTVPLDELAQMTAMAERQFGPVYMLNQIDEAMAKSENQHAGSSDGRKKQIAIKRFCKKTQKRCNTKKHLVRYKVVIDEISNAARCEFTGQEEVHICEVREKLLTIVESVEDLRMDVGPSQPGVMEVHETTQNVYKQTLVVVLEDYVQFLHGAHAEINSVRAEIAGLRAKLQLSETESQAKLLHSEKETESAQTKANKTWLDLAASRCRQCMAVTLREEVARLAEELRELKTYAEGSKQLFMGQLEDARTALLKHQLAKVL
jgi:hypothetical protein